MMKLEPNQCRGGCSADVDRGTGSDYIFFDTYISVEPLTGMLQALLWDFPILRTAFSLLLVMSILEDSLTAAGSFQQRYKAPVGSALLPSFIHLVPCKCDCHILVPCLSVLVTLLANALPITHCVRHYLG